MTRRIRLTLVSLALAVVAVLAAVLGVPTGDDQPTVVTTPLAPAAIADPAQPNTIEVPADDLEQAADALDDHQGARAERPPGVTPAELDAGAKQRQQAARQDRLPETAPLAAPAQDGCRSSFVRNYSSRNGVAPRIIVIHYTVSGNRPGWGDVDAVTGWFNQARSGASSNYVVDAEAHCRYIVRESDKAWTQAGFNPWSISIEVVNSGKESNLTSAAGYRRLGQIISDSAERWDIPLRQAAVSGCSVTRSGVIDHSRLGSCGGNHHDITPFTLKFVIDAAIRDRAMSSGPKTTAADRVLCRKLVWFRRQAKPRSAAVVRNAVRRREALASRRLRCTTAGKLARIT